MYSKTKSHKIEQLVNQVGGTSVPGQNAFIGELPDEKRIEAYLRRQVRIRPRGLTSHFLFRLFRLAYRVGCNAIKLRDLELITSIRLPPRAPVCLLRDVDF